MNYKDIIDELQIKSFELEEEYENNGGEVTDYTEEQEAYIKALQELIENDGIDFIGRKLKEKEDLKKSIKAEQDYLKRQEDKIDRGFDFWKYLMNKALKALGITEAKGHNGYKFSTYTSETTSVNKEVLKNNYTERVRKILDENGIPSYITFTLNASSTLADGCLMEQDKDLFIHESKETIRFTKPRKSKREE